MLWYIMGRFWCIMAFLSYFFCLYFWFFRFIWMCFCMICWGWSITDFFLFSLLDFFRFDMIFGGLFLMMMKLLNWFVFFEVFFLMWMIGWAGKWFIFIEEICWLGIGLIEFEWSIRMMLQRDLLILKLI